MFGYRFFGWGGRRSSSGKVGILFVVLGLVSVVVFLYFGVFCGGGCFGGCGGVWVFG